MRQSTELISPLIAAAGAVLVCGLIVSVAGYDASAVLYGLMNGALGNANSLSETLLRTCPLILTGLAVAVAFRCGIWNIGAEGQFLMGALAAAAIAPVLSESPDYIGTPAILLIGTLAGSLWAGLAGWLKVSRHVQEVISTIMLNFVAIQLLGYAVHGPLMEASGQFPQTDLLGDGLRLSRLFGSNRVHSGMLLALVCTASVWVFLFRTVAGYRIRAVGINVEAAKSAGVDSRQTVLMAMLLSGGLAGLAGAVEFPGVTYRLYDQFGSGFGYTAIAVALLGRLNPTGILPAALLFGALAAGANGMQREAGVSAVLVYVIQGLILLFVVVAAVYERRRPRRGAGS